MMNDIPIEDDRCKYLHGHPKDLNIEQKFRLILRLLRQDFPPEYPVRVRRVTKDVLGPDAPYGICWLVNNDKPKSERYYKILINKKYPWKSQFETLLHEWAHTLAWHLVENGKDHGDIFHRYFGNLYRAYIDD